MVFEQKTLAGFILAFLVGLTACGSDSDSSDSGNDAGNNGGEPQEPTTLSFTYAPSQFASRELYVAVNVDDTWTTYTESDEVVIPAGETVIVVSTCVNTSNGDNYNTRVYQLTPADDFDLGILECGWAGNSIQAYVNPTFDYIAGLLVMENGLNPPGSTADFYYLNPRYLTTGIAALGFIYDKDADVERIYKTSLDLQNSDNFTFDLDSADTQVLQYDDLVNADVDVYYYMPGSDFDYEISKGDTYALIPADLRTQGDKYEMRLTAHNFYTDGDFDYSDDTTYSHYASQADTNQQSITPVGELPYDIELSQDETSFTLNADVLTTDGTLPLQYLTFLLGSYTYYVDYGTYTKHSGVPVVDLNSLPDFTWNTAPAAPAPNNRVRISYCYAANLKACIEPAAGDVVRLEERSAHASSVIF